MIANMPDKIITELWRIKENIAQEHGYDIDALVVHLQAEKRLDGQHMVDLRSLKAAAESQQPSRSKTDR